MNKQITVTITVDESSCTAKASEADLYSLGMCIGSAINGVYNGIEFCKWGPELVGGLISGLCVDCWFFPEDVAKAIDDDGRKPVEKQQ